MKKYYKFIFISLFGLFIFLPKDTFAWTSADNVDLYRGYSINMSDTEEQVVGNVSVPHKIISYVEQDDRFLYGIRIYKAISSQDYEKFTKFSVDVTIWQDSVGGWQNSINEKAQTAFAVFNTNNLPGNESCSVIERTKSYTKWRCTASFDNYTTITGFNLRLGVLSGFDTTIPLGSLTNKVVTDSGVHPDTKDIYLQYVGYDISVSPDPNTEILNEQLDEQKKTNQKIDETNEKLDEAEETRKGIWETIKELPGKLLDMLVGLFIPDDMSFLDNFRESLEDKLGFIAEVPLAILDFLFNLVSAGWDSFNSITLPSIEMFGVSFWDSQEISLQPAIDIFSPYKYITDVICVVLCVNTLRKWYENFASGGGN